MPKKVKETSSAKAHQKLTKMSPNVMLPLSGIQQLLFAFDAEWLSAMGVYLTKKSKSFLYKLVRIAAINNLTMREIHDFHTTECKNGPNKKHFNANLCSQVEKIS